MRKSKTEYMKPSFTLVVWLAAILSIAMPSSSPAAPPPGYTLAWADEFEGSQLDAAQWSHRGLGQRRDAINTTDAVAVGNGLLTIRTHTVNGHHRTGMIATQGKFERSFGYWEARIRFDDAPGMWSAFWIQTDTMGQPPGDPARAGMEIDVIEHRVTDDKGRSLAGKVQHTLHWDGYGKGHKSKGHLTDDLGLGRGFHTYGLEWTETEYRFFVDGKLTWTAPTPVSKKNQFIILSSEVHDGRWAGKVPEAGYGNLETSTTRMVVDYVRFYEKQ